MLVYSDETGIDDNEVMLTGWAPRGERCHAQKKAERTTRYNITAALNLNLLFAPFLFEGYSTKAVYEIYVEQVLAPALKPGMVVVIDNASFHKSKKIIELIEAVQCRVLFLPPYSPDFNPIEHLWTAVKNAIKKAAESIDDFYEAAVQALGEMCGAK
jgi:transposase